MILLLMEEILVAGKWKNIVLAASLALNLAFVASFVFNKIDTPKRTAPENGIEQKMQLRKDQHKAIHSITKEFNVNFLKFKQDILDKRMEIIEEVGDPEFDPATLERRTNELNDLENQLNHSFVETMVQVSNILDSQQRLNFLIKLSKNWFFLEDRPSGAKND